MKILIDARGVESETSPASFFLRGFLAGLTQLPQAMKMVTVLTSPSTIALPPLFPLISDMTKVDGTIDLIHYLDRPVSILPGREPYVITLTAPLHQNEGWFKGAARTYLNRSQMVTAPLSAILRQMGNGQFLADKVQLEPFPVEVIDSHAQTRDNTELSFKLKIANSLPTHYLLCTAADQLSPVLLAFGSLYARDRQLRLVIYTGSSGSKVMAEVVARHLTAAVALVANLKWDDFLALHFAADAVIVPASTGGFTVSAAVALGLGRPLLCVNHPNLIEQVGEAAVYFTQDDPVDLSDRLHQVLAQAGMRDSLLKAGAEVKQARSWKDYAQRMIELYKEFEI